MIKIYDLNDIDISDIFTRIEEETSLDEVEKIVDEVIRDVKDNGDIALKKYTEKFDKSRLEEIQVNESELDEAIERLDNRIVSIFEEASKNIYDFHKRQVRTDYVINDEDGKILGQKIIPLESVGIYVPGGTARYPSSVFMNAIPAKIAGVKNISLVTPPNPDGSIPDIILAAAKIAGVDKVYKIGGAQSIAALAYGTETVRSVDKIVGPGNIFVATAKRKVFGKVDIDMIAGPSEILVIADDSSNPAYIAADLLSQAEHDVLASAVLVCTDINLAEQTAQEVERQLKLLPREDIARKSIDDNGKIIVAKNINEAFDIVNELAPEHLEISMDNPFDYLSKIKNAGSVFLGKNVPEALGDYFAGMNHTLPTSGTAKFSSPLSVDDFVKKTQFVYYSKEALESVRDKVSEFAKLEGLDAHARSIDIRFE